MLRRRRGGLSFTNIGVGVVVGFLSGVYIFQPFLKLVNKDEPNSYTRTFSLAPIEPSAEPATNASQSSVTTVTSN